jgi:hypothetical protein
LLLEQLAQALERTGAGLEALFSKADRNGSGSIDADEFAPFVRDRLKIRTMTDTQVERLFRSVIGGSHVLRRQLALSASRLPRSSFICLTHLRLTTHQMLVPCLHL